MSTMYPLAVVSAGSITHLARTTLCHYSIRAYATSIKRSEGTMMLGGQARYAAEDDLDAQGASDTCGVKTLKTPMTIEEATTH